MGGMDFFTQFGLHKFGDLHGIAFSVHFLPETAAEFVESDPEIGVFHLRDEMLSQPGVSEFRFQKYDLIFVDDLVGNERTRNRLVHAQPRFPALFFAKQTILLLLLLKFYEFFIRVFDHYIAEYQENQQASPPETFETVR